MKFIQYIIVVAAIAFLLAQFLPWWSVAIAGFSGPWIVKRGYWASFAGGFLGIFLLWTITAALITYSTGYQLPEKVATLISPSISALGLAAISGVIGGLVGGLASISARILRG